MLVEYDCLLTRTVQDVADVFTQEMEAPGRSPDAITIRSVFSASQQKLQPTAAMSCCLRLVSFIQNQSKLIADKV